MIQEAYIKAVDAKIAKSFYDSFKKNHGKTRFVRDKKYHSVIVNTKTEFSYTVKIPQYTIYSSDGRDKGKLPPLKALKEWAIFKGFYKKGIEYAIAKSISNKGTQYNHAKGNQKDTLVEPMRFAKEQIKLLRSQVAKDIKSRFLQFATKQEIIIRL